MLPKESSNQTVSPVWALPPRPQKCASGGCRSKGSNKLSPVKDGFVPLVALFVHGSILRELGTVSGGPSEFVNLLYILRRREQQVAQGAD